MEKTNHTFAICAYKESPFLEECIQSLVNQTVKTNIILGTATPNAYIEDLCSKYEIPLYINTGEHGITQDWNFAYSKVETEYVTIAHQDDVYDAHYVENLLELIPKAKKPLIFFTDYYELRGGQAVKSNKLLRIKRILLFPLRGKCFWHSKFIRRRMLSFGAAICCPSVTFMRTNLPEQVFHNKYRADEDWEAWESISKLEGSFVFCKKPLTFHRIHEDSETTKILGDNARTWEDIEMFEKFWPKGIAKILAKLYGTSEKSNDL